MHGPPASPPPWPHLCGLEPERMQRRLFPARAWSAPSSTPRPPQPLGVSLTKNLPVVTTVWRARQISLKKTSTTKQFHFSSAFPSFLVR